MSTTSTSTPQPRYERQLRPRCDGPCPRLWRPVPDGAADHPSRGDELLRHRQRRSVDLSRRHCELVASGWLAVIDATRQVRRGISRSADAWDSHICNRRSPRPSASGRACGHMIWHSIWRKSNIDWRRSCARSTKGTTGTQASFSAALRRRSRRRFASLEQLVAQKMGFSATYAVTGQTYPRKIDSQVLDVSAGIAATRP